MYAPRKRANIGAGFPVARVAIQFAIDTRVASENQPTSQIRCGSASRSRKPTVRRERRRSGSLTTTRIGRSNTNPEFAEANSGASFSDPGHHRSQIGADLLDLVALLLLAQSLEVLLAGAVLRDPLPREVAGLDVGEDLLHRLPPLGTDHAWAPGEVAVLGRVRDRVAHARDALLVHEVDDQLELVQALEIGEARVVAGFDQRLEPRLHQLGGAPAEHGLLAEEVGLGLVLEGR